MARLLSLRCVASTALGVTKRSCSSTKRSSAEYRIQSDAPLMLHQMSLPRLPIPKLEDTVRRYLAAQRPRLDDDQFRRTEKIAHDFQSGVGKRLQEELEARDKNKTHMSYITEEHMDRYLSIRCSMMLINPFMGFKPDPKTEYNEQLVRATNMVCSAVSIMKTLRAGLQEPGVSHLNPAKSEPDGFKRLVRWAPSFMSRQLDMSPFFRLFNSTRIPRRRVDEPFTDEEARHVLVMRKGNMHVFDIADRDGNLVTPAEIQSHLEYILSDPTPAAVFPLGVLTSENRDVWAGLREALIAAGNADNLQVVDSALFCLSLDDESTWDQINFSHKVLHGDGCNRWFDKSFTIILTKDGQAAISFEHSWADGIAMLVFQNEIFVETTERPPVHPGSAAAAVDSASTVRRLRFNLDSELENGIKKAKENFDSLVSTLSIDALEFKQGGKALLKKSKLSPDAVAQLAFQMGFLRQYGHTASACQACSIAAFRYGRTELIWPVTLQTQRCSHAFVVQPGQHGVEQLQAMLRECSTYHRQLIKEGITGQGIGNHLPALEYLSNSKGEALHGLFTDPAYIAFNDSILESSTLTSPALGFSSLTPYMLDGFGLFYSILDDQIGFTACSYPTRDGHEFLQCVHKSLEDIFTVLEGGKLR